MPGKERQDSRDSLQATTSERLAAIVEAAERAAAQVIDDAEEEAQRRLAEAESLVAERLSALTLQTDSLIAQAEEIRQRSEYLLTALSRVKAQLEAEAPAPAPSVRGAHLSAVAPIEEAAVAASDPPPKAAAEAPAKLAERRDGAAAARLLATQLAISGSSREEIAGRLRNGFEIDDPEAILDAILGPEE